MKSVRSPVYDYPAIELDMTNFMEYLSDEYICGKAEARIDGVRANPKILDCKTENCVDLGETSSISEVGRELEGKVRKFNIEFVVYYREGFW